MAAAQLRRPAVVVALGFAAMILVATVLLMLPAAHEGGEATTFRQALFTATSAVCVTGLVVVDTPTHWSTFGELVIVAGIQAGGLGFMTSASLLGVLVARRLGLRSRVLAAAETRSVGLGDVRQVIRGVVLISLVVEGAVAVLLALRFWLGYDMGAGRAMYYGAFHAVSSFNNAGFALYTDNLIGFATDPLVCLPIAAAVIIGGIGFPVILELRRGLRSTGLWSVHTKITLLGTALLLVAGTGLVTAFEWRNPGTLGPMGVADKLFVGFFQGGVQPRTAGFNSLDYAQVHETSLLVTDGLMFIGGGSGGTAGGIKVATFMLLLLAIVAEVRGDPTVDAFGRQVPAAVLRQALSVALVGVAVVGGATLALLAVSGLDLDRVLFEAVSAFATVGLSTGITAQLPPAGQYILIGLMFLGRIGPITFAAALALRQSRKLFRRPEERVIVG
ncbi:potassium transporter TrkG [Actinoplanes sp. NPDC049118]|uniref:TrkH family potassium uptake protein n=1 Tax=Actinoplanes sp. NPDC049118 TaxID=3155769 RepID=UPI0033C0DC3D